MTVLLYLSSRRMYHVRPMRLVRLVRIVAGVAFSC